MGPRISPRLILVTVCTLCKHKLQLQTINEIIRKVYTHLALSIIIREAHIQMYALVRNTIIREVYITHLVTVEHVI